MLSFSRVPYLLFVPLRVPSWITNELLRVSSRITNELSTGDARARTSYRRNRRRSTDPPLSARDADQPRLRADRGDHRPGRAGAGCGTPACACAARPWAARPGRPGGDQTPARVDDGPDHRAVRARAR